MPVPEHSIRHIAQSPLNAITIRLSEMIRTFRSSLSSTCVKVSTIYESPPPSVAYATNPDSVAERAKY